MHSGKAFFDVFGSLSMLAHEIKNPIAGIRSGIQLLKGRTVKDGDKMLCDSMIHEIDRVTALIMNLLTLSIRRESPKTEISVTGVLKEIGMIYAKGPDSAAHRFLWRQKRD